MNSFARFVFSLLIAGGVVNFTIVWLANSHSQQLQRQHMAAEKVQFSHILDDVSGRLRRADFVVESQQLDAHGQAMQTKLLVRQYASTGSFETRPLHVARVVIPGNQLAVDGMLLEATDDFAKDAPDFQILRGTKLAYFGVICGKDEGPPDSLQTPDPRFTFLVRYDVPQLTRIDPAAENPLSYERALWTYLWTMIPEVPPPSHTLTVHGLKITWFPPQVIAINRENTDRPYESTYTAYVNPEGLSPLEKNSQLTMPGLRDEMLELGKKLDETPP